MKLLVLLLLVSVVFAAEQAQEAETEETTIVENPGFNRAEILKTFNEVRCAVSPRAESMPALQWEDALATIAQQYVDTCPYSTVQRGQSPHRTPQVLGTEYTAAGGTHAQAFAGGRVRVGEVMSYGVDSLKDAILLQWVGYKSATDRTAAKDQELEYYTTNGCPIDKIKNCGHYTQIIWAKSTYVGCGVKFDCPKNEKQNSERPKQYVCNFAIAGNTYDETKKLLPPYPIAADQTVAQDTDACIASRAPTNFLEKAARTHRLHKMKKQHHKKVSHHSHQSHGNVATILLQARNALRSADEALY